jgi:hypothetical protein
MTFLYKLMSTEFTFKKLDFKALQFGRNNVKMWL